MKQDDQGFKVALDLAAGRLRLADEARRLVLMKGAATPPAEMRAAPVAPARGVQQLVPDWDLLPGGTRRRAGAHWITPTGLHVINEMDRRAQPAPADGQAGGQAVRKAADLFTPSQVAMGARYAELVEWRAASGVKGGKLEASHGGSDPGLFIDRFIDAGAELARLQAAIGPGMALVPKYGRDTDNVRRKIPVRAALDAVLLQGRSLSWVLKSHGWQPKGLLRRDLVMALRGALDRMMVQ